MLFREWTAESQDCFSLTLVLLLSFVQCGMAAVSVVEKDVLVGLSVHLPSVFRSVVLGLNKSILEKGDKCLKKSWMVGEKNAYVYIINLHTNNGVIKRTELEYVEEKDSLG